MKINRANFVVKVGVFSAMAFVLQLIGSLMNITIAGFLEVEISDLPAIIISLALGPVAGVAVELIKNLLHCMVTSTGFVGELANFVVNGTFVFACGVLYKFNKTKKGAIISLGVSTLIMGVASIFSNLFIMLPLYMASAPFSTKMNLTLYTILPFNLVRGAALSLITIFIYKRLSRIIKG